MTNALTVALSDILKTACSGAGWRTKQIAVFGVRERMLFFNTFVFLIFSFRLCFVRKILLHFVGIYFDFKSPFCFLMALLKVASKYALL